MCSHSHSVITSFRIADGGPVSFYAINSVKGSFFIVYLCKISLKFKYNFMTNALDFGS